MPLNQGESEPDLLFSLSTLTSSNAWATASSGIWIQPSFQFAPISTSCDTRATKSRGIWIQSTCNVVSMCTSSEMATPESRGLRIQPSFQLGSTTTTRKCNLLEKHIHMTRLPWLSEWTNCIEVWFAPQNYGHNPALSIFSAETVFPSLAYFLRFGNASRSERQRERLPIWVDSPSRETMPTGHKICAVFFRENALCRQALAIVPQLHPKRNCMKSHLRQ